MLVHRVASPAGPSGRTPLLLIGSVNEDQEVLCRDHDAGASRSLTDDSRES